MSSGMINVPKRVCFNCIIQLFILVTGIVLCIIMGEVATVSKQNTSTVSQISDDWYTVPFVKLQVTDDKCPSDYESIFVREWGGLEQGCLVNKLNTFTYGS